MQARVAVLDEIRDDSDPGEWCLCLQRVRYVYANAEVENGFRFIWRRADGSLQAARGQARIPHLSDALRLIYRAVEQGWEQVPSLNPTSPASTVADRNPTE